MISSSRNEEMLRGIEEMEMQEAMQEARQGCRIFAMHCENFARIAKISQGLRKFRKDCENFATIAKISQSLRKFCYAQFFAMLEKCRYYSENSLS